MTHGENVVPAPFPAARGVRVEWTALPVAAKAWVQSRLGGEVVEAATQPGGFSPGVAARIATADGTRAFLKAVSSAGDAESGALHRREAAITAALGRLRPPPPEVPRLLATAEVDGWVLLLLEDVDGTAPAPPWDDGALDRVLGALAHLWASLTPVPAGLGLLPVDERLGAAFRGWRRFAGDPGRLVRLEAAAGDGADDLRWARGRLDHLAAVESRWPAAARGTTLLHLDLRADNLLLTPDRVVVVDWPHAGVGAAWVDLVLMLPSIPLDGGPQPEEVLRRTPVTEGVPASAVDAVAAALTGFLLWGCLLPDPPGLPTVRGYQRAQGEVALAWLRRRLGDRS